MFCPFVTFFLGGAGARWWNRLGHFIYRFLVDDAALSTFFPADVSLFLKSKQHLDFSVKFSSLHLSFFLKLVFQKWFFLRDLNSLYRGVWKPDRTLCSVPGEEVGVHVTRDRVFPLLCHSHFWPEQKHSRHTHSGVSEPRSLGLRMLL